MNGSKKNWNYLNDTSRIGSFMVPCYSNWLGYAKIDKKFSLFQKVYRLLKWEQTRRDVFFELSECLRANIKRRLDKFNEISGIVVMFVDNCSWSLCIQQITLPVQENIEGCIFALEPSMQVIKLLFYFRSMKNKLVFDWPFIHVIWPMQFSLSTGC